MADKGPGSTGRSSNKRLARAKIKPSENGIKSSKGRTQEVETTLSKAELKEQRKKKITAIAVGAFAVIMALSMTLPSLTYIFGNRSAQQTQEQTQEQQTQSEDSTDESTTEETLTGMEAVDANYKAVIDPLEKKLEEKSDDLATLLSLGNDYTSWASEASSYATDDESSAHVKELYEKAMEYYDRYLALNDSAVVKASKAMCMLYNGDQEGALAALQTLTQESPDYGPAWANIGYIYENQGETDKAKEAYEKAIEADPDNEYGAKSYANRRLVALAAQSGGGLTDEAAESAASNSSSTGGANALEDALGLNL